MCSTSHFGTTNHKSVFLLSALKIVSLRFLLRFTKHTSLVVFGPYVYCTCHEIVRVVLYAPLSPHPVPPLGSPPQAQCLGGRWPPLPLPLPLLLGTRAIRKYSPRRPMAHRFRRQADQLSALLSSTAKSRCRSPPLWAGAASCVPVPPTKQAGCLLRQRSDVRALGPLHG